MIRIGPLTGSIASLIRDLGALQVVANQSAPILSATVQGAAAAGEASRSASSSLDAAREHASRFRSDVEQHSQAAERASSSAASSASNARRSVDGLRDSTRDLERESRSRFAAVATAAAGARAAVSFDTAAIRSSVDETVAEVDRSTQTVVDRIRERTGDAEQQLIRLSHALALGTAGVSDALEFLEGKTGTYAQSLRDLIEAIRTGKRDLDDLRQFVAGLEDSLGHNALLTEFADAVEDAFSEGRL